MEPITVGPFLVVDPGVCHGKMTFKGTRMPVETVLSFLAQGEAIEQSFCKAGRKLSGKR